jgi:hypothetical protein
MYPVKSAVTLMALILTTLNLPSGYFQKRTPPQGIGLLGASGTLVVLIPTKDGLLFAADSRTIVAGTTCDQQYKIVELVHRKHTAISVTGFGSFLPVHGSVPTDVCKYLKDTPPLFNAAQVVQEQLDTESGALDRAEIAALAEKCKEAVVQFGVDHRQSNPLEQFRGKGILRVIVGNYDPQHKKSLAISFDVLIGAEDLGVQLGETFWHETKMEDDSQPVLFGETAYVEKYVFTVGRSYLDPYLKFVLNPSKTKNVTVAEAQKVAINLIEATSRTTEIIPAPSGIGGPVDVLLLDNKPQPTRLKWKKI